MFDTGSPPSSDISPTILRPAEVAERLGISAATLRRWSSRFSEFLELGDSNQDGGSHRRYTARDVATLSRVKELLEQGWTYEQVADRLSQAAGEIGAETDAGEPTPNVADPADTARSAETAMVAADAILGEGTDLAQDDLPPAARLLRDTLNSVANTQQIILNSQHASRDMLGVMIQDNLNLKGENTSLRERMLELERELAELHRHFVDTRERTEIRMRVLEDAIAKLMAGQQQPARSAPPAGAPPASTPVPPPAQASAPPSAAQPSYPTQGYAASYPPAGYPPQPQPASSYPQPYATQPAPKRGFWARLLGG